MLKLLTLAFIFSSIIGFSQKATIEYEGIANSRLYINVPLKNGEFFNGSFITTRTSQDGHAAFEINIKSPAFVQITSPQVKGLIYIIPGAKTKITEWNEKFSFSGSLRKENEALKQIFIGSSPHAIGLEPKFVKNLTQAGDPAYIAQAIEENIDKALDKIDQFKIDENFKLLLKRLAMYQAYDKATAVLALKFREYMYSRQDKNVTVDWKTTYDLFFTEKLITSKDKSLPAYFNYLFNYLVRYKAFFLKENVTEKRSDMDLADYYNSVYFVTAVPALIEQLPTQIKAWFSANYISQFIMGSSEYHTSQLRQFYEKTKINYDIKPYDDFLAERLNNALKK